MLYQIKYEMIYSLRYLPSINKLKNKKYLKI